MTEANTDPIDSYIAQWPPEVQEKLIALRESIRAAAPGAVEKIAYGVPTFYHHGNLVHFGAAKRHIGFYPAPSAIVAFADELAGLSTSKGAVRFPLNKPLPLDLVARMVRFRVEENESRRINKETG